MVRVFRPGLLSIIGTVAPFSLAWFFLTYPETSQPESGGPPVGLLIAFGAGFAGMVLLSFSILLLVDYAHHRIWGAIVALLYGPASYIIILILMELASSSNARAFPIGIAGLAAQTLGMVGGIWGFFEGTAWTPWGVARALVGPTARVFYGGLVSVFATALIGSAAVVIPAMLVLGPFWLYVDSSKRRTVGFVLLGISLGYGLLALIFVGRLWLTFHGWAGYDAEIPDMLAVMFGSVLAASGSIQLTRRRPSDGQKVDIKPV